MNEKSYKVLKGFIELSDSEKSTFIEEINKYQNAGYIERQRLYESVKLKSSLGPKNSICTCCGR